MDPRPIVTDRLMSSGRRDLIDQTAKEASKFNEILQKYLEYINRCSAPDSESFATSSVKKQKIDQDDEVLNNNLNRDGIFTTNEQNQINEHYWRILSPPQSSVQDLHADFASDDQLAGWKDYLNFYMNKFIMPYSLIHFDMGNFLACFALSFFHFIKIKISIKAVHCHMCKGIRSQ